MLESMKVGVSLNLKGDATTKLSTFVKNLGKASATVEALEKKLNNVSVAMEKMATVMAKMTPVLRDFVTETNLAGKELRYLSSGARLNVNSFTLLNRGMALANTRISNMSHGVRYLKKELDGLTPAMISSGMAAITMGGGGNKRTGGGGRGHGNRLGHMLGHEMGGGAVGGILGSMAFGGASTPLLLGGLGAVMLGKASFEANSRFLQAQAQYAQQGFGTAANNQAANFATHTQIKGISATDLMGAVSDAITVTRNPGAALALAPSIAKMEFANSQIYAQQGRSFTRNDEMNMLKLAELKSGSTDPAKFLKTLNLVEQGYASDAARLTPLDLRNLGRQAGIMIPQLTDSNFAGILPLVQSIGGYRVGTGLTTFESSMLKGQNMRTGKRAVSEFEKLGIFGDNGQLKKQYTKQVTSAPLDFLYQTLLPAMAKKGITSMPDVTKEMSVLFSQTVSRLFMQAIEQEPRIMAQMALVPKAGDIQSNYMKALNLPSGTTKAFGAAWDSLMTAFGKLTSAPVIGGINFLTSAITKLTSVITMVNDTPGKRVLADKVLSIAPSALVPGIGTAHNLLDSYEGIKNLFNKASGNSDVTTHNPVNTKSATTGTIVINVDGRMLAQALIPSMSDMLYNSNISNVGRFNPSLSPTVASNTRNF